MHILKILFKTTFIILVSLLSCTSKGALTPEDAFISITRAYVKSDADAVATQLSKSSIEKIRKIIKMISSMDEKQIFTLSKRFGTSPDRLTNLSVKDYISLQFALAKRMNENFMREIAVSKIIDIDIKDKVAIVKAENGMELKFVKEGPYWKFEMTDL